MQISDIIDAMIDLINKNLIAKAPTTADALSGETVIKVTNSFHFTAGQEIIFIDGGYNTPGDVHFEKYEYSVVKCVDDTRTITLQKPLESSWFVSQQTFIQKTIGHAPLYEGNVLYGDRDVIPTNEMAITVEPVTLTNEWIYIQGGLSEEYRVKLMIYGMSVNTEEGMRILNKYTDALYQLVNDSIHFNVNNYQTPLIDDFEIGDSKYCIEDTPDNRENFLVSATSGNEYEMQDNVEPPCSRFDVVGRTISGGKICLEVMLPTDREFLISEFAVVSKLNRYIYDSRVDNVSWGIVQKGSAILRAAELSWFGKEVNEHRFPQHDKRPIYFEEEDGCSESTSSSSSSSG